MTNNTGDKLPVEIVTTVIDKISDFTREIEILRAQLPTKDSTREGNNEVLKGTESLKTSINELNTGIEHLTSLIKSSIKQVMWIFGIISFIVFIITAAVQVIEYNKNNIFKEVIKEAIEESATSSTDNKIDR